jgi:CubicO group peptidase (beta-lactamase class C family)
MRPSLFGLAVLGLIACGGAARNPSAPLGADGADRVRASLVPAVHVQGTLRYRLDERMERYRVPGVSMAVADAGRVVWARGFGVTEAGSRHAVTPTTLFQAGSISKPVTATATLRLVAAGKLSLDEDVNTYLRSWKVPETELTAHEKVTLRRILSHSAGTTVHGFPGYAANEPLPTVQQVLDGDKPANTKPVRVEVTPGTESRYSGGGATIEQLALVEVTGKPFPALLDQLVLGPIGMTHSTFEEPLSPAHEREAAAAHDTTGALVPGRFHVYPEMAAAGLWSTPTDLLEWAIAISAARAGRPNAVLPQSLAVQMLTTQKAPFGLGPLLEGNGRGFHFGHPGEDEGFLCELVYFPETEQGAAVMVNGGGGRALIREILYAIAAEYGWPDYGPPTIQVLPMDAAALDRVVGTYEAFFEVSRVTATVRREGTKLVLDVPRLGIDSEAVFTSPTSLTTLDGGDVFSVLVDEGGRVTALKFGDFEIPRSPHRM